jgi:raffinose/stachyose/melibiose transport system substrate-binding protein
MTKKTPRWRISLLAAIALLIALVGAGCGSSDSSSTSTSGASTSAGGTSTTAAADSPSGTLTFAAASSQEPGWTKVIDAFEKKYPDVKVRPNFVPITTYNQVVTTQFQGGQGPDVLFTSVGSAYPTAIGVLGEQGQLEDLSDMPAAEQVPDLIKQVGMYDGKRVAMPIGAWTGFFLYNKDKFSELGLEPPQTMDELLAMCGKIADAGLTPVAIGPTDGDLANFYTLLVASMVQNTDPDWVQQRDANKVTFAGTKGWQQALQAIVDMKDAKCFDSGVAGMSRDAATASWVQGKAVMMPLFQNQLAPTLAGNPAFQWGAFPAPGQTPGQQTMFAEVSPLISINSKSKNMDAAKAFVNFAMEPAQTGTYADAQGVISTGQLAEKKLPDYLQPYAKYLFKGDKAASLVTSQFKTPVTYDVLSKGLVGLLTGQVKVDELLKQMDDTYGQK